MKTHCKDCNDKSCAVSVLSEEELESLAGNSSESFIKKGEVLFKQGSLTTSVVYLKKGLFKEYITTEMKRDYITQIIQERSYLGLSSLFGDKINRYSYAAIEDSTVCYIDSGILKNLILGNGHFAYEILTITNKENLNNNFRYLLTNQKQVYGKFADVLLFFAKNIYFSNTFNLPVTHQEIASFIGISRESVTRMVNKLKSEGLIDYKNREILIKDIKQLEKLSQIG